MSSVGVFYLDEDDKDSPSATLTNESPSALPSTSSSSNPPAPTTLQIPQSGPSLLPQTQNFGRKSGVFAATPSFPSPLAQAITVPTHSDSSSSSHSSPHHSDDEDHDVDCAESISLRTEPTLRPESSTSRLPSSCSNSGTATPSSSRRSVSRPSSPSQSRQAFIPGALIINRAKRSASGSYLSGSASSGLRNSPPRPASAQKLESASSQTLTRSDTWRNTSPANSHAGSASGSSGSGIPSEAAMAPGSSSPLAFGSPELDPVPGPDHLSAPRPIAVASPSPTRDRNANILGLGWVPNWDGSSAIKDRTKGKEAWRPPSPKRDLASPISMSSSLRPRRASEFLRPSSMDLRKPPPSPSTGRIVTSALPNLSSSASMVSPLNPLPSPWSEVPLGQSFGSSDLSSSTTSQGGNAIRLNKVPTSVRLAADLIKNTQSHTPPLQQGETPSSTASVRTPNPSPADSEKVLDGMTVRKQALAPSTSLPIVHTSTSPTAHRWGTVDSIETASLSPLSSLSVSSGDFLSQTPGQARSTIDDGAGGVDPAAVHQRLQPLRSTTYEAFTSPLQLFNSPSPVQTVSPASLASSVVDEASHIGSGPRSDGSSTPGGFPSAPIQSRLRSVAQKGGLAMDLPGVASAMGDAASHASMIMQSRQAKVQRWGPRNSISAAPAIYTLPEASAPSRLSASYVEQPGGHWVSPMSSSQTGKLNPNAHLAPNDRYHTAKTERRADAASHHGGVKMEKQVSATGSITGIEWVDWYDCYKAYKAEKIRAEASTKASSEDATAGSPIVPTAGDSQSKHDPLPSSTLMVGESTAPIPVTSRDESTPSLQPSQSGSLAFRRRSLSIRSTISAIDHKMSSPNPKRSSVLERPRQSSGGSTKSSIAGDSQFSALKRKKNLNLVNKMEGWWNAVKSNFNPDPPESPAHLSSTGPHPRTPSAPQSRRGSRRSSRTLIDDSLAVPESGRQISTASSSRSLRRAPVSQIDFHGGETATSSATVPFSALKPTASLPPPPPAHMEPLSLPASDKAVRRGLESRRNQPSLRLVLEPAALGIHSMEPASLPRAIGTVPQDIRPESAFNSFPPSDSRPSSYGSVPGFSKRDPTPAALASNPSSHPDKDNKPVAPGAEVTVASVRQHVKQRLNAAKVQCDDTLRRIMATISAFEEERLATEVIEDQRRDYFDTFSDSPIMDPADSEDDNIPPIGSFSSRGPSRRGSVSLSTNVLSSPSRRVAMLSSVPTSPRRSMSSRRRPSIVPRVIARDIQQASRLHVDHPQSTSSSRSTSRSRSPMPLTRPLVTNQPAVEDAIETNRQFLAALQELIVLSTDVLETSVDSLISRPTCCADIISKLQRTGQYWDDHEDWPGRDWYVDILMAVASLSRVLQWWEAEKGFWNFEDDPNEPLTYVFRPFKDTPQFDLGGGGSAAASPLVLPSAGPVGPGTALTLAPSESHRQVPREDVARTTEETNQAVEDLRNLAEQAKSINIVMELSLQGQEILYVNDAIYEVVGREPEEVLELPITELLAPADTSHFAEATERLLEDDGNTVEVRFRFEVHDIEDTPEGREPGPVYIELEGVGMLIREGNEPSHTMWVMKPVMACQVDNITDAVFPRLGNISTESVLCRICEREIIVWFFEKHNETCDAVHRLEAEITEAKECINDLHQCLTKLAADLGAQSRDPSQGLLFFSLPDSVSNTEQPSTPQGVEVRKVEFSELQNVADILAVAKQIEIPSVQEDEADLPFNLQRYLSRESEEKLLLVTRWQKPAASDRGLSVLYANVEDQLRRQQKAIARMQSTIRYSEKTRHEWEDKVNKLLDDRDDATASESGSDSALSHTEHGQEHVSPGHRRIAPLARLPITGHPQRPAPVSSASQPTITTTESSIGDPDRPAIAPTNSLSTIPSVAPTPTTSATSPAPPGTPKLTSETRGRQLRAQHSPVSRTSEQSAKGHARRISSAVRDGPMSPRIPSSGLPGARAPPPSIKDFQIIKPISRGAFGSVYLAKKVATGDYYAIKALKKSDMIAKNQITNVKAERTILMNQATSPYVVKLFFSFQSKDYLYLVMEYLNGGDCSTLVKTLGSLPVDWARNYIGELVLGLEYLHARNITHRDVKPDNLLIDSRGHLKLTDFGLSKIGLLNRQIGGPIPPYLKGTSLRSVAVARRASSVSSSESPILSPDLVPIVNHSNRSQSYFPQVSESGSADESSGSESTGLIPRHLRQDAKSSADAGTASNSGAEPPRFVGTPDYLAPESILGGGADDRMVDWWAVGVVLYEFLYGFPPFHADTPEKVFDNVVSRRINWHDDEIDIPPAAHDLMDRLMCANPAQRLGARGADEVKQHAFFAGVDWTTLTANPAVFIPDGTDPESTDYFDQRGATKAFHDEEISPMALRKEGETSSHGAVTTPGGTDIAQDSVHSDDFGAFNFKNLPVLKQANDDVIRKMRSQTLASATPVMDVPRDRRRSHRSNSRHIPPSPSTSTSSAASTPSRAPVTQGLHARRPSELNALTRVKSTDDDKVRRYSSPSRFRAGSGSSASERSPSVDFWQQHRPSRAEVVQLLPASDTALSPRNSLTVLIAEDNPISQKILETLLSRLGCHCVCVQDGPDALAVTGNLKFDVIFVDMHMPFVSGEQVARMIRSTTNPNQNTPIIAATAYDEIITEEGTLFSAILAKPFSRDELMRCLSKVGFIISSTSASERSPVVA